MLLSFSVLQKKPSVCVFVGATQTFLLAENQYGDTSSLSAKILVYDESALDADGQPSAMFEFALDKFQEIDAPEGLAFVPDDRCECLYWGDLQLGSPRNREISNKARR